MKEQLLESQNQLLNSDELFMSHIFIVDGIIKKLYYNNYLKDDLRQVGLIGLFKASNKYNYSFGVKFSTYATYFILGEIKRELRNNKNIRLGQKTIKIISLLNKISADVINSPLFLHFCIDYKFIITTVLWFVNSFLINF